ncbi:MAG: Ig-like domain-containing protein [Cyanobacteriota bacterium]
MTSQVPSNNSPLSGQIRSRLLLFFLVCTIALTGYTLALQHSCNPIIDWATNQQVIRDQCKNPPPADKIRVSIEPSSVSVAVNSHAKVKAIVKGQGSANAGVDWKSENTKIAQVDDNGIVTGIKTGNTQIEARSVNDANQKAVAEVYVEGNRGCSPQAAVAIGTVVTIGTAVLLVPPPIAFGVGSAAATGLCWLIDKVN